MAEGVLQRLSLQILRTLERYTSGLQVTEVFLWLGYACGRVTSFKLLGIPMAEVFL